MDEQVVKYNVTDAVIAEMSEMYMGLVITDLDDKEQFDAVHSARMVVRKKRIEVDHTRKELKADALKWGRAVQNEANRIFNLIEPIETHLRNEEGKAEAEKQRLEDIRIAGIRAGIEHIQNLLPNLNGVGTVEQLTTVIDELAAINVVPDMFFEFMGETEQAVRNALDQAHQALEQRQRIDREEAEHKAESERLAAEKKIQDERESQLKVQEEKQAEVQRKIDEDRAKAEAALKAERDAIETEKRELQEKKDREAFEVKAKQEAEEAATRKAESDRKDKEAENIRIEQERIEKEKAAAAEKERIEGLKPDKSKLEAFAQFLMEGITYPTCENKSAEEIIAGAALELEKLSNLIFEKAQDM